MNWYSADLHFGHANIITYSHRPFADVEEMNEAIVDVWNATVGDDDRVWLLGDVALGHLTRSLEWVRMLKGHVTLVPGNHDRCAAYHRHAAAAESRYLDVGVERIVQGPVTTTLAGRLVLLDHFPYTGDSHGAVDRYAEQRPVDGGQFLLHGHVHDEWRQRERMINVGIDAWGGHLVSEDDIVLRLADPHAQLDALEWS